MNKIFVFLLFAISAFLISACKNYESVSNDPTQARIYTLNNGLKVYMSVNPEEPRVQAHIAVRAGSKNDPRETTGLAHYLEHIMFKGTSQFGTLDYATEKPMLDEIEQLYEKYRVTKDKDERKAIYHQIDSVSYVASTYAVANEYDKMMANIGSRGSNAYTGFDVTCYVEDIPSNEIERWAMVQSSRFKDLVIRGFHTELEAVYEEFNMSLTNDNEKVWDKMFSLLYRKHPYGLQTTLGTQDHLKNPSIKNIKEFYNTWYVPNNVAICLSGDFDPESTLTVIEKYFGDWKPSATVPVMSFEPEEPMVKPISGEVVGQEDESVWLGWRFPGAKDVDTDAMLEIVQSIVDNGKSGLFDTNLLFQQKVLSAEFFAYTQSDYTTLVATGQPNEGQSLDEVRDLLLENINLVAKGEFDEKILTAILNNKKLQRMQYLEHNAGRVNAFVESFVNGQEWSSVVDKIDRLSKITKPQVVEFAKKFINDGYAVVYKRRGQDNSVAPIEKPAISPIEMNRDKESDFVKALSAMTTQDIQPKFVDFDKEITKGDIKNGNDFLYVQNKNNGLFNLCFRFDRGVKSDRVLDMLSDFSRYIRTPDMTAEEIHAEFYQLACSIFLYSEAQYTNLNLSGLAENQERALALAEKVLNEGYVEDETFNAVRGQIMQDRENIKTNQNVCFRALYNYALSPVNEYTNTLSNKELASLTPVALNESLREVMKAKQTVVCYTPTPAEEMKATLERIHKFAENVEENKENDDYQPEIISKPELFIAPYQAANIKMSQISVDGTCFSPGNMAATELFNNYFGSGMNSVVFQELREARGLAYSAYAGLLSRPKAENARTYFLTMITTQNDKLYDCLSTFKGIIEELPSADNAFATAKSSIIKRIESMRTLGVDIIYRYLDCKKMGVDHDYYSDVYTKVQDMTLDDLKAFHEKNIKGRVYRTVILGDEKQLDSEILKSQGEIRRLSLEDIFGF